MPTPTFTYDPRPGPAAFVPTAMLNQWIKARPVRPVPVYVALGGKTFTPSGTYAEHKRRFGTSRAFTPPDDPQPMV